MLKPSEEVQKVQENIGNQTITYRGRERKFMIMDTARYGKKYGVRPKGRQEDQSKTAVKYCAYDTTHDDYLYTEEWVDFLSSELSGRDNFESLYNT